MNGRSSRHLLLLIISALLITTSACTPQSSLIAKTPVTILGTLASFEMPEAVEARIVISRNKHVVEETVPVINNEFSATLQVPIGEWEVTVLLVDAEGMVLFQSKAQSMKIAPNGPQLLELVLRPADSQVHVSIDLEQYVFRHVALRARIHFNDEVHEVVREDSLSPLEGIIDLTPGSYEFKIELYTESFRVGDRLGPGAWEVIHVRESEELYIHWSPASEALFVSGRVETLLPAPTNVTLRDVLEGVSLTWDPVIHRDLVGYFVFAQTSPLERFELLNPLPLEEPHFTYKIELEQPPEINYVVAAVSANGLVGYYSHPQIWNP